MHRFTTPLAGPAAMVALCACLGLAPRPAVGQLTEPFLGQQMLTAANFCPKGWAEANGQLLPINQNQGLFSLYGTMYGGDGQVTFALPDLRGRAPIHEGTGPGLSTYTQGEKAGHEAMTLVTNTMPPHNHSLQASSQFANGRGPRDKYPARTADLAVYHAGPPDRLLPADMVSNTGGGQAFAMREPFLAMKWCVALQGVFPEPQ